MKYHKLFLLLFFFANNVLAQTDTIKVKSFRSFCLSYDNDVFLATDRYYTQGIYLELVAPLAKKFPTSFLLIPINKYAENQYSLCIEHDVFTPYSILHAGIYADERPYTATFFVSHKLKSMDEKRVWETKLDLGIIGPSAFGEQMQKGIHRALDNALPLGWDTQLSDDLILNYSVTALKRITKKNFVVVCLLRNYRIGTLYDDAGLGFNFELGNRYLKSNRKFGLSLFGKSEVNAVAYNATLQGGIFNRTNLYTLKNSQIERILFKAEGGINLQIKRLRIIYSLNYVTREFHSGLDHSWGHVQCVIAF